MEGQKHGVEMKDFVLESLASEGSDRTSKGSSGHHSYTPVPADEEDRNFAADSTPLGNHRRALPWALAFSAIVIALYALLSGRLTHKNSVDESESFRHAGLQAVRAGIPGAAAMVVQVLALMWARTIVNYQYRHGVSMSEAATTLYNQGGIPRLYRGLVPALIQGPLARFGDTASNEGVQALLDSHALTSGLPIGIKTLLCSFAAGIWRIFIMPVDTIKTKMQVEGKGAVAVLVAQVLRNGPGCLYEGWLANQIATMMGHYPWFATRNYLMTYIFKVCSSCRECEQTRRKCISSLSLSHTDINPFKSAQFRFIKQNSHRHLTYTEAARAIARADGPSGLFLRGLSTKLLVNAFQSILFNILWEYFQVSFKGDVKGGVSSGTPIPSSN